MIANYEIKLRSKPSCQKCGLLAAVALGCMPDGKAEPDLVDKVGNIVDGIQWSIIDCTQEVPEEVAERVDGPANGDDEAHGVERRLHGIRHALSGCLAALASKDLEKNEGPSGKAHSKAGPSVDDLGLAPM